jgi:ABC-type amino acid transport substrate-binding protein
MTVVKIGRYEIQSELGRGGMATVYKAYDPHFKRVVAIKVLPLEFLHDPNFQARFEREATTIAALEHPAIVPVHDFDVAHGQPYLVMRFMPGGSLEDRLDKGLLSLAEAAVLYTHLAPALDKAHAHGTIHRDLKPTNILYDEDGHPYIADFGIAKLSEATTTLTAGSIVGTPAYMSPEQGQGLPDIDGRSDVYALGAMLYQLLCGQLPFNATTPHGMIIQHINNPLPDIRRTRPDLPEAVQAILAKAMAKAPDERYPTAGALAQALEEAAKADAGAQAKHQDRTPDVPAPASDATNIRPVAALPARPASHAPLGAGQPAPAARQSTQLNGPQAPSILPVIMRGRPAVIASGGASHRLELEPAGGLALTGKLGASVAPARPARRGLWLGLVGLIGVLTLGGLALWSAWQGGWLSPAGPIHIRVATDATWPPFESVNEQTKEIEGFDIDLMKAIAAKEGLEVEFINVPFDPLLAGMATCQYNAAISAITITEERKKDFAFSDPYFAAGEIIIVRVDNTDIKSRADLVGKTIGVQIATTGEIEAKKIRDVTVLSYDNHGLVFQDLMNGRLDAVITDNPLALQYVGPNIDKIKTVGDVFTDGFYGIAVCKTNTNLLAKINAGLKAVKDDGTLDKLIQQWFISGHTANPTSTLMPFITFAERMPTLTTQPAFAGDKSIFILAYEYLSARTISEAIVCCQ